MKTLEIKSLPKNLQDKEEQQRYSSKFIESQSGKVFVVGELLSLIRLK